MNRELVNKNTIIHEELKYKIESILKNQEMQKETAHLEVARYIIKSVDSSNNFDNLCHKFQIRPREKEIITWVLKDKTNKEIAEEINLSENTIKSHMRHIFEKLKADRNCIIYSNLYLSNTEFFTINHSKFTSFHTRITLLKFDFNVNLISVICLD